VADRSQVLRSSAAYAALGEGGQRVLKVIEEEVRRGGSAISLDDLVDATGSCRSSVRRGIRQVEALGFLTVAMTARHANQFALSDGWREVDTADEAKRLLKLAKLPTPPRARTVPPKRVRPVKVEVEVERPPVEPQRYAPSLPTLAWLGR
jgi:hypothetical protein